MQLLRKLWEDAAFRIGLPGQRLTEYLLISAYSAVAILSLIVGITARAGTLFGRAVDSTSYGTRPELKAILKQLAIASADFSVGASLLVVAAVIVFWSRRGRRVRREALEPTVPSGPPFLL